MSFKESLRKYIEFEQLRYSLINNENTHGDILIKKINEISKTITNSIIKNWDVIDSLNIGQIINETLVSRHYREMVICLLLRIQTTEHPVFRRLFDVVFHIKRIMEQCYNQSCRHDLSISLIKFNQVISKIRQIELDGFQDITNDDEKISGTKYNGPDDISKSKINEVGSKVYNLIKTIIKEKDTTRENDQEIKLVESNKREKIKVPVRKTQTPVVLIREFNKQDMGLKSDIGLAIGMHVDENSVIEEYLHQDRMNYVEIIAPRRVNSLKGCIGIQIGARQRFSLL